MRITMLSMAVGLLIACVAAADDCCAPPTCAAAQACCGMKHVCSRCGTQQTCQVVCETKKVKKTVWRVEREDFCVPLPGCDIGSGCGNRCNHGCCDTGCDGCAGSCGGCCEDPCADLLSRKLVPPKCGKVRTRQKLVKDEITCEVPTYKCVVSACGACGACGETIEVVEPEEALPEAPAPSEAPAPPEDTSELAPLPPVLRVSYQTILKDRE
ncbi:MAG TPA: hypothetical protein VE890_14435 [Thermoguttaceae bacterium]|nr:hypothetical protein [Thermoguttaceae bacterium]